LNRHSRVTGARPGRMNSIAPDTRVNDESDKTR
jgi:hypothetical protein